MRRIVFSTLFIMSFCTLVNGNIMPSAFASSLDPLVEFVECRTETRYIVKDLYGRYDVWPAEPELELREKMGLEVVWSGVVYEYFYEVSPLYANYSAIRRDDFMAEIRDIVGEVQFPPEWEETEARKDPLPWVSVWRGVTRALMSGTVEKFQYCSSNFFIEKCPRGI